MARRRLRTSLVVIARDETASLPRALGSVRGLFDGVVVCVDDRTADDTAGVARGLGAEVFTFTWCDSFAAARNAALDHATGDYACWLDADEWLGPAEAARLDSLLDSLRPDRLFAHAMRQVSVVDGITWPVAQVRLFPLRPDVRFRHRVHEQVTPALRDAGIPVHDSGIAVRHDGLSDPAVYQVKLDRNRRLSALDLAEYPDDPHVRETAARLAMG